MFNCAVCNAPFPSRAALLRHNSTVERCLTKNRPVFACALDGCFAKYHRHDFLVRHERKVHKLNSVPKRRQPYYRIQLPQPDAELADKVPGTREPIITKAVILNVLQPERNASKFFETLKPSLCKILTDAVQKYQQIMFDISLEAKLLQNPDGIDGREHMFEVKTYFSKDIALRSPLDVEITVDIISNLIVTQSIDEIRKSDLNEILQLEISISKLIPQVGGYIPVHPQIAATKAVLNVKNSDPYCFKWAILAGLSIESKLPNNLSSTSSYQIADIKHERIYYRNMMVDFSGLNFPLEVRDVHVFEDNNPELSVHVFGVEDSGMKCKIVGPLYRTRTERKIHMNLLFYENQQKTACHYVLIRSLPLLLRKQLGEESTSPEICNNCLTFFKNAELFAEHKSGPMVCGESNGLS